MSRKGNDTNVSLPFHVFRLPLEPSGNTGNAITREDTPFYIWNEIACKRIKENLPNNLDKVSKTLYVSLDKETFLYLLVSVMCFYFPFHLE